MLKIPNVARVGTDVTHVWPISYVNGPIFQGVDPMLAEHTHHQGVKSENKFCFMKYPFHTMAHTLALALDDTSFGRGHATKKRE